jgi:hypothetical protein
MAMNPEVRRKTKGLAIKAQTLVGSLRGKRPILNNTMVTTGRGPKQKNMNDVTAVFPAEVNIGNQSRDKVQGRFLGDRGETKERTVLLPNGFTHCVVH